jgi:protein-S-isoprenylcysteine O-methyltransferase Ste14
MKRISILLFGVAVYAVFFATFLYLVAFVGNLQTTALAQWLPALPGLVPRSVDFGGRNEPVLLAAAIDLGLILLFGMQHSVMARMGFKAWLKTKLPESAERSVYVLLASLVLMLMFWQWRPIPGLVWSASSVAGQIVGWSVFAFGFGLVLLSTFLIDHFDLFGLKQVWRQFAGHSAAPSAHFVTPLIYRLVRHPLYLGFILAMWGGPVMSAGRLLFAAAMTGYILIAIQLEEKDLIHNFGERYANYRRQVPMLVPRARRRPSETARSAS